jgi:hypothetical protein
MERVGKHGIVVDERKLVIICATLVLVAILLAISCGFLSAWLKDTREMVDILNAENATKTEMYNLLFEKYTDVLASQDLVLTEWKTYLSE